MSHKEVNDAHASHQSQTLTIFMADKQADVSQKNVDVHASMQKLSGGFGRLYIHLAFFCPNPPAESA